MKVQKMKRSYFLQFAKIILLNLLSLAFFSPAISQNTTDCFKPNALKNLCMMIDGRMKYESSDKILDSLLLHSSPAKLKEIIEPPYYLFQKKIYEAAWVDFYKDSREVAFAKIRRMWLQYEDKLVCNGLNFDVINGNLIKYAINTKFDDFIDVVSEWGINLNKVDESDGRTILDYTSYHMKRNEGTEVATRLKSYYDTFRKAGAKHKHEL